jgi:hypothetical protein
MCGKPHQSGFRTVCHSDSICRADFRPRRRHIQPPWIEHRKSPVCRRQRTRSGQANFGGFPRQSRRRVRGLSAYATKMRRSLLLASSVAASSKGETGSVITGAGLRPAFRIAQAPVRSTPLAMLGAMRLCVAPRRPRSASGREFVRSLRRCCADAVETPGRPTDLTGLRRVKHRGGCGATVLHLYSSRGKGRDFRGLGFVRNV